MPIIENIRVLAAGKNKTVVLPEGSDLRMIQAAIEVRALGIAKPLLLATTDALSRIANAHDLDITGLAVLDPAVLSQSTALQAHLQSCKRYQDFSTDDIRQALNNPLTAACCLLATGEADACVAGVATSTSTVIQTGLRVIGMAKEQTLLSSFMLMAFEQKEAVEHDLPFALFADCAINIAPDSQALVQIAASTAGSAERLFGLAPKVAMLSFSSAGSAEHADVDKVRQAFEIFERKYPALQVIGEVQFDAALLPHVRQQKMPGASFSEPANVYVFPDLNAGNIGYKIAERIGGTQVVGPILQGLDKPLNDLSRGADMRSIVNTIALSCLQA